MNVRNNLTFGVVVVVVINNRLEDFFKVDVFKMQAVRSFVNALLIFIPLYFGILNGLRESYSKEEKKRKWD
jgi:tellurite resistance protein TehA-like permease